MTFPGPTPDASGSQAESQRVLADFSAAGPHLSWYVVNDNVMGGRSEGDFGIEQGELRFAGCTNTDGGGFSSIRTKSLQLDLSAYAGIRLRVRGDGRRYTWRLTTRARWRGREIGYWADFDTKDGAWSTVDIPFFEFVPRYRGTQLDGPELDPREITGMGMMIYDKLDGPFEVHITSIAAYPTRPPISLEQHRWKHRVLVISASTAADEDLVRLQAEVAANPAEFEDRDLMLVTLVDDGTSVAGSRVLTDAEAAAIRADLGIRPGRFALRLIGKDGSVKLSAGPEVAMSGIYDVIDAMPMRRQEMSDR